MGELDQRADHVAHASARTSSCDRRGLGASVELPVRLLATCAGLIHVLVNDRYRQADRPPQAYGAGGLCGSTARQSQRGSQATPQTRL